MILFAFLLENRFTNVLFFDPESFGIRYLFICTINHRHFLRNNILVVPKQKHAKSQLRFIYRVHFLAPSSICSTFDSSLHHPQSLLSQA